MFKETRNFMTGFAVGVGVGLVAREAWPYVAEAIRPLAKACTKASVKIYKRLEYNYWAARETLEDMVAESQSEIENQEISKEQAKRDSEREKIQKKKEFSVVSEEPQPEESHVSAH